MYVCQVSRFYSFALSRYCAEENAGINMPLSAAAGGWHGGPVAVGLAWLPW